VTSGHVEFETLTGQTPACFATPSWLDAVLARQASFLHLGVPDKVPYHWRPMPDDLPCRPGAIACTDWPPVDIYARPPDMVHELVHAIFASNIGRTVSFFNEGAAVALGGQDHAGEPAPNYDRPLDPVIAAEVLPFSEYPMAGDFASYLLSTREPERYVELLRRAPVSADAGAVRAAFLAAYGESIDDVVAERRVSTRAFIGFRLAFPECSIPQVPWTGNSWQHKTALSCYSSGIGPIFNDAPTSSDTFATVDVPSDGYYHATIASSGGFASLSRCKDGAQAASLSFEDEPGAGQREILAALSGDLHFWTLRARTGTPASFTIELEPTLNASARCSPPPPLDVADTTNAISFLGGGLGIIASIRVGVPRTWKVKASGDSGLWLCADPCAASGCLLVLPGTSFSMSAGLTYTFRAHGPDVALVQ
jgi:hypothetical protein